MKKLFLFALILGNATLGFTQTKFTEQTLNEIHQAFVTNPTGTVVERTSPDFTLSGGDGSVIGYTIFKSWNDAGGLAEWPVSDVKVQQSGNLAVAKGISKHWPKGTKAAVHQRFTEVYEYQNGKWMFTSAHYTDIAPSK